MTDVEDRRQVLKVEHFATPEDFRDYFKANYGPTIAVYRNIADDSDRVGALDRDLADLGRRFDTGDGKSVLEWSTCCSSRSGLNPSLIHGGGGAG